MQECLNLIVQVLSCCWIFQFDGLSLVYNATREILVTVYVDNGGLKSRGTIRRVIFWRDVFLM